MEVHEVTSASHSCQPNLFHRVAVMIKLGKGALLILRKYRAGLKQCNDYFTSTVYIET